MGKVAWKKSNRRNDLAASLSHTKSVEPETE